MSDSIDLQAYEVVSQILLQHELSETPCRLRLLLDVFHLRLRLVVGDLSDSCIEQFLRYGIADLVTDICDIPLLAALGIYIDSVDYLTWYLIRQQVVAYLNAPVPSGLVVIAEYIYHLCTLQVLGISCTLPVLGSAAAVGCRSVAEPFKCLDVLLTLRDEYYLLVADTVKMIERYLALIKSSLLVICPVVRFPEIPEGLFFPRVVGLLLGNTRSMELIDVLPPESRSVSVVVLM